MARSFQRGWSVGIVPPAPTTKRCAESNNSWHENTSILLYNRSGPSNTKYSNYLERDNSLSCDSTNAKMAEESSVPGTDLESGSTNSAAELKAERIATLEGEIAAAGGAENIRTIEEQEEEEKEAKDEPADPFLVEWEENDPGNPLNYKARTKAMVMIMIASLAFLTYAYPRLIA